MFKTLDEAMAFIRHESVATVDLKFCDLWGRWRHVTLPASQFGPALLRDGVGFDGSSLGLTAVKSGDLVLVPELGTGFLDPFWELEGGGLQPREPASSRRSARKSAPCATGRTRTRSSCTTTSSRAGVIESPAARGLAVRPAGSFQTARGSV